MNTTLVTQEFMTGLTNRKLAQHLKSIQTAIANGNKSAWTIARKYYEILEGNEFEDDFQTLGNFANSIGVSKGYVSQCANAVEFVNEHQLSDTEYTVGKAYLLSSLGEEYEDFVSYAQEHEIVVSQLSDKVLKDAIKEWRKQLTEAIDEENTDAGNEADEKEVDEVEDSKIVSPFEAVVTLLSQLTDEELDEVVVIISKMK